MAEPIDSADPAITALARFGAAVITAARSAPVARPLSPDLHAAALTSGVFVPITATERCGEGCACATEGFPHDCLTCPDDVEAAICALYSRHSQVVVHCTTTHSQEGA